MDVVAVIDTRGIMVLLNLTRNNNFYLYIE